MWFLETSDSQSIHRRQLTDLRHLSIIGFLEASGSKSIHHCRLSNAWFVEASDSKSIHRSIAANFSNFGFLAASDLKSTHGCQLHYVWFLQHPAQRASTAANKTLTRRAGNSVNPQFVQAAYMAQESGPDQQVMLLACVGAAVPQGNLISSVRYTT